MEDKYEDYVHVLQFNVGDAMEGKLRWRQKFWQIFPCFCASLIAVPFGIMLGWPSPIYPYLIQPTSAIPITLSQSAMIAGFLMIGVTFATPFSSKYHLGPKYGIWIGMILITIGWILMWYSRDIFWLLGSRLVVGLGSGYGMGQVRGFINDMCDPKLAVILNKQLNFHAFFGVIIAYAIGIILDFRKFTYVPIIFSVILLFITMFLPCTPKDFLKRNNLDKVVMLLDFLRGKRDHTEEIERKQTELEQSDDCFLILFKNWKQCKRLLKFILLVFLQQFSGGPTTIIYCQIIFTRSGCMYPEYSSLLYSFIFFMSNIFGVFYAPILNKKIVLILSSVGSSIMLMAQILILYFEVNSKFWPFTSFVVLSFFIVFYCVGVGNIPFTYIPEWFPKKHKTGLTNFFIMEFSICALVATKLFQVLMEKFSLLTGFCMFLVADLIFLFLVIFTVRNKQDLELNSYVQSNSIHFWNMEDVKLNKKEQMSQR